MTNITLHYNFRFVLTTYNTPGNRGDSALLFVR